MKFINYKIFLSLTGLSCVSLFDTQAANAAVMGAQCHRTFPAPDSNGFIRITINNDWTTATTHYIKYKGNENDSAVNTMNINFKCNVIDDFKFFCTTPDFPTKIMGGNSYKFGRGDDGILRYEIMRNGVKHEHHIYECFEILE